MGRVKQAAEIERIRQSLHAQEAQSTLALERQALEHAKALLAYEQAALQLRETRPNNGTTLTTAAMIDQAEVKSVLAAVPSQPEELPEPRKEEGERLTPAMIPCMLPDGCCTHFFLRCGMLMAACFSPCLLNPLMLSAITRAQAQARLACCSSN